MGWFPTPLLVLQFVPEVPQVPEHDLLLCGRDDPLGLVEGVGVQGDAVDSLLHEELGELGVHGGSLSADADELSVLVCDLDELCDRPLDSLVPLVEVSHASEDVGVPVASHGELGEVVGSDGECIAAMKMLTGTSAMK